MPQPHCLHARTHYGIAYTYLDIFLSQFLLEEQKVASYSIIKSHMSPLMHYFFQFLAYLSKKMKISTNVNIFNVVKIPL